MRNCRVEFDVSKVHRLSMCGVLFSAELDIRRPDYLGVMTSMRGATVVFADIKQRPGRCESSALEQTSASMIEEAVLDTPTD